MKAFIIFMQKQRDFQIFRIEKLNKSEKHSILHKFYLRENNRTLLNKNGVLLQKNILIKDKL